MQATSDSKPSAAAIMASYLAYPFADPYFSAVALQAGQALAVASSGMQGQVSFARCLLQNSTGIFLCASALNACWQPNASTPTTIRLPLCW